MKKLMLTTIICIAIATFSACKKDANFEPSDSTNQIDFIKQINKSMSVEADTTAIDFTDPTKPQFGGPVG